MSDRFLSDDREMRLRQNACPTCRDCRHYTVRESWVLDGLQEGCGMVNEEAPNGPVVLVLMLRLAKLEGACPGKEAFEED